MILSFVAFVLYSFFTIIIKLKSRLSVCPSICIFGTQTTQPCLHGLKQDLLAQNESYVFEDHKVYFYKTVVPTVHQQETKV